MADRSSPPADRPPILDALRDAERCARKGDPAVAERAFRALLADLRLLPHMPMDAYGRARNGLGRLLASQGRSEEAIEVFHKTIGVLDALLSQSTGRDRDELRATLELARAMVMLSGLRHRAGALDDAESLVNRAVCDVLRRVMPAWELRNPSSETMAATLSDMAMELCSQQRPDHAERMLRLELAERERLECPVRVSSRTRIRLAQCLMQQGKHVEAERMFRWALEQRIKANLPLDATTKARCWLATCLLEMRRPEDAEQLLLDGLSELRALDDQPRSRAALRYTLARVNLDQGRQEEAKEMLTRGLEDLEGHGGDPDTAALHRVGLAKILHAEGQRARAEATLLQAIDQGRVTALHPSTLEMIRQHLAAFRRDPSRGSLGETVGRTTLHGLEAGGMP